MASCARSPFSLEEKVVKPKNHLLIRSASLAALPLIIALLASPAAAQKPTFVASLSGGEEVPAVDTRARGQTVLHVSGDATELRFKLIVANIEGMTQAHIHCGAPGVNGPVVVFLFGLMPLGVSINGIASEGTVTAADVIPRPDSPSCPGGIANFNELLARIFAGEAYVNVHTLDNPGGEIRGQIR
jgi:hypothetical protein